MVWIGVFSFCHYRYLFLYNDWPVYTSLKAVYRRWLIISRILNICLWCFLNFLFHIGCIFSQKTCRVWDHMESLVVKTWGGTGRQGLLCPPHPCHPCSLDKTSLLIHVVFEWENGYFYSDLYALAFIVLKNACFQEALTKGVSSKS